jgi:hypothetical protein
MWRYRRLNATTTPTMTRYPTCRTFLPGCLVFSKIDLIRGYHQIPVSHEAISKTAVITPFKLYEYLRMPFGLKCDEHSNIKWSIVYDCISSEKSLCFLLLIEILFIIAYWQVFIYICKYQHTSNSTTLKLCGVRTY